MKIPFYRHNVGEAEIEAVSNVLRSLVHTAGPVTKQFEQEFADYLGCQHAVGMTSWTMGVFLCLRALGIGPGDEVITTPLTFLSTANVICHVGARPVFVDVERTTGLIDLNLVEQAITKHTKAIIPVHLYGAMCDMRGLAELAASHRISIIEDAAHCIEGIRDGIRPAQLSQAAGFSFYATKNLGCGDGGAIASNDENLASHLAQLRFHAMTRGAEERYSNTYRHYDMEELGYKCNLTDIQAALLRPQLKSIDEYLTRKEKIAKMYEQAFRELPGVDLIAAPPKTRHARHIFTLLAPEGRRDAFLLGIQEAGIGVAVHFNPVHLATYYRRTFGFKEGDFPNAERIGRRTMTLPCYPKLTEEEVAYVINSIRQLVDYLHHKAD